MDQIEPLLESCAGDMGMGIAEVYLSSTGSAFELVVGADNTDPDEFVLLEFARHCEPMFVAAGGRFSASRLVDVDVRSMREANAARKAEEAAADAASVGAAGRVLRYRCSMPLLGPPPEEFQAVSAAKQIGGRITEWTTIEDEALFHLVLDGPCDLLDSEIKSAFNAALSAVVLVDGPFQGLETHLFQMSEQADKAFRDPQIHFKSWRLGWQDARFTPLPPARTRIAADDI
jgi:hypothetical protein